MIDPAIIREYNRHRRHTDKSKICHAPFTSMNFEQNGHVTACCFNRTDVLGTYPEMSLKEIWEGASAAFLREKIDEQNLEGGCKLCRILLESGNYNGTKAIYYDEYGYKSPAEKLRSLVGIEKKMLPRVFEFEISNTCNLECDMCSGYFSSTIRKNREHLPPIANPYDDAFVEQVATFLPHLTDLKFLGGEPFLIDIYYKIWDRIVEVNPLAKVHITTNGTVLNQRVKDLLSKLNVGIVVSIDSLDPARFEEIRAGAKLERVLENFEFFRSLTRQKGTYMSVACCAMTNNWQDLPGMVRFANEKQVSLHFNVVWNPGHLSLRFLDHNELEKIESFLNAQHFDTHGKIQRQNVMAYQELIQTIGHWKKERSHTRLNNLDQYISLNLQYPELFENIPTDPAELKTIAAILVAHFVKEKPTLQAYLKGLNLPEGMQEMPRGFVKTALFDLWRKMGDHHFTSCYFQLLPYLGAMFFGQAHFDELKEKAISVGEFVRSMKDQQAVLSDMIDDIDRKSIANQLQLLEGNTATQLIAHLQEAY